MTGSLANHLALQFAQPIFIGALEQKIVSNEAVFRLLVACGLGALVGLEREWKGQSAGIRTNMLICLGCAFFTLLSPVVAGDGSTNKGQIASNIVQGIGFLGAGLIIHNRARVSGLASAASIFVVASIGMACGAGLFLPAAIATVIILVAMALIGVVEWRANLKSYPLVYEARGHESDPLLISILDAMDKEKLRLETVQQDTIGVIERASFSLTANRRCHDRLRQRLLSEPAVDDLKTFRDPDAD